MVEIRFMKKSKKRSTLLKEFNTFFDGRLAGIYAISILIIGLLGRWIIDVTDGGLKSLQETHWQRL
jgi:hypothetical protein